MKLYRIKDWSTRFENNRTRELKKLDWVPTPNRHDGDGYTSLLAHKNGEALFGAWNAILQVASRCNGTIPQEGAVSTAGGCGRRGTLIQDSGKPHDAASISRRTRFSESTIKTALDVLSSKDVGWLEVIEITNENEVPAGGCGNPAASPDSTAPIPQEGITEGKGREGNRTEGNGSTSAGECEFEKFWTAYPRKVGKGLAKPAFLKARTLTNLEAILAAVAVATQSRDWLKENGQYIPHPTTWLNQQRWLDEPTAVGGALTAEQHHQTPDQF